MHSEDVARAAASLGGNASWPAVAGEPVFDEPWQGRAFAMAFEVLERTGLPWDAFRERLVAAIADEPGRPYYESWLVAVEQLALDVAAVDPDAIARARNRAAAYRYDEEGVGDIETFPFQPDTDEAYDVLTELFAGSPAVVPRHCRHAELYRIWVNGAPMSWGVRVFVGEELEQFDVELPRLARWDELRLRLLGLGPDP